MCREPNRFEWEICNRRGPCDRTGLAVRDGALVVQI
jgi:hypothetical protein